MMDSARWDRLQSLFHQAVDRPAAEQRRFLEAACGDDHQLLADALAMLEEDARRASVLDRPIGGIAHALVGRIEGSTLDPAEFHPYRLERLLGEGGMGVVYLAEREDLGNRVAIKILRDAWLSSSRRKRFAVEQRTLAQLNHPGIARLYDAHVLADGTPWFVMEYVDGAPLTEYCARGRCSVRERLALFRAVCEAVAHAHAHGVIHRDLKPSNILVKEDGTVRLLDFGIAKQLDSLDPAADQARTTMRMMTPAYAAPEQLRGEGTGVHTDVYALGVILYELVAGRLPFDLSRRSVGEAVFATTHDPAKPSAIAREAARTGGGTAGAGNTSWADLDVLCMTCMHRDPERRYPSVDALIRDVDHFLVDEPLEARPDTLPYTVGRFLRRRWRAVAAATGAFVAVGGLALALGMVLSARLRPEVSQAPGRTVAVLPFRNESAVPGLDYLRLALPEEVVTALSYTRSLAVRPFSATSRYQGDPADVRRAGRELGVGTIVTGRFQRAGDSLEVTLEAVDAAGARSLWSSTFTVPAGNMIALRRQTVMQAEGGLVAALGASTTLPPAVASPENEEAYDLYLRSASARYDPGDANEGAIAILERVVALDSTYAPAWLALSRRMYVQANYVTGDAATMARAVAANERAVALDPEFIAAGARMAALRLEQGELVRAYRDAAELIRRRPDNPDAHWTLGYVYRFAGLLEASAAECATALSLDPHNFGWRSCAVVSLARGDYQGAMGYIQLDAGSEFSKALTIHTLVRQGRERDALAVGRPYMPQWKSYDMLLACAAHRPAADIARLAAAVQPEVDPETNYYAAMHLSYCGQTTAALDMLRRSIRGHYCAFPALDTEPFFTNLRDLPEFAAVRAEAQSCQKGFLSAIGRVTD